MAASASDLLQKVGLSTATTLSAPGYTAGATSMTVGATAEWPSDTGITFAVDTVTVVNGVETQDAGSYNEYIGTVASGTSISNVAWADGNGDQNYAAGSTTRVYIPVSKTRENRIVTWGTVGHTQLGAHIASLPLTTPKITTSINDSAGNELFKVTATGSAVNELTVANAATGAGPTLSATGGDTNVDVNFATKGTGAFKFNSNPANFGASVAWTPTWTNLTTTSGTNASTYFQIGKLVVCFLDFTFGASSALGSSASFTLPVTSKSLKVDAGLGTISYFDSSGAAGYQLNITWKSTADAFVRAPASSGSGILNQGTSSTIPVAFGTSDRISGYFIYEAA